MTEIKLTALAAEIRKIYGHRPAVKYIDLELLLRIQGEINDTQFTKLYFS